MGPDAAGTGYLLDAPYPDTFFRELSPAWLNYVALLRSAPVCDLDRPFTYLELGCGLGSSVVTYAGAFPKGQFHACDFNPLYIEQASRRAADFGIANIEFHPAGFADLLPSLPLLDFIVVHGVYSWVGPAERQAIRRLVRDRLKAGGRLYVSYNSLPGWATEVPLRRWLLELSDPGKSSDTATRVSQALDSLRQFGKLGLRYFEANPAAATALESYSRAPISYLAHEFFNEAWEPFYGVDVADQMAEAGVAYLGSATLAENHPELLLDESINQAIGRLASDRQRRLAADFATNQQFRRDVFMRAQDGTVPVTRLGTAVIGCVSPDELTTRIKVPRGNVRFQEDFIQQLKLVMTRGSVTMDSAIAALGSGGTGAAEIARNLAYLIAGGALAPFAKAHRPIPVEEIRQPANAIVGRILQYAVERGIDCILPSEVVGGGVRIQPQEALAVTQWLSGNRAVDAADPAVIAALRLSRLGLLS